VLFRLGSAYDRGLDGHDAYATGEGGALGPFLIPKRTLPKTARRLSMCGGARARGSSCRQDQPPAACKGRTSLPVGLSPSKHAMGELHKITWYMRPSSTFQTPEYEKWNKPFRLVT
jgi:hypothetical protein